MKCSLKVVKKAIVLFGIVFVFASCASRKNIVYMQDNRNGTHNAAKYETTLQPDDNLIITVTSDQPELANPFNLIYLTIRGTNMNTIGGANMDVLISYLVDQNGEINFPVLGRIKLGGLTRLEAEDKIRKLLEKQIVNPGVSLKVINFKVSVFGEVVRPNTYPVIGDRITLLEALSLAGDLTIYGDRKEIFVIREKEGVKTTATIDITKSDFIDSPYYYLAHNDQIYVQPNKTRINSSVIGPNITVGISALSLIITIIALTTR